MLRPLSSASLLMRAPIRERMAWGGEWGRRDQRAASDARHLLERRLLEGRTLRARFRPGRRRAPIPRKEGREPALPAQTVDQEPADVEGIAPPGVQLVEVAVAGLDRAHATLPRLAPRPNSARNATASCAWSGCLGSGPSVAGLRSSSSERKCVANAARNARMP